MIIMPYTFMPPVIALSLIPLVYFIFKLGKLLALYRQGMRASWRQAFAACLTGLSLSHTVGRAILAGFTKQDVGFYRTPKHVSTHSIRQALSNVREEGLFGFALLLAAITTVFRDDAYLLDTQLWILLLLVQALPYCSAVILSVISTLNGLPASLVLGTEKQTLLEKLPSSRRITPSADTQELDVLATELTRTTSDLSANTENVLILKTTDRLSSIQHHPKEDLVS